MHACKAAVTQILFCIFLCIKLQTGESISSETLIEERDLLPLEYEDVLSDAFKLDIDSQNVHLVYFNALGQVLARAPITHNLDPTVTGCVPGGKVVMIIHGWKGNCSQDWAVGLMKNFGTFRGGCLICMDYSYYGSDESYVKLFRMYAALLASLVTKLQLMIQQGHQPAQMFFFGFSFGGRLALGAGKACGYQIFEGMDICEPAGPGFERTRVNVDCDERAAAKNVQIIHTSIKKYGSRCTTGGHQNVRMGNCGFDQEASRGSSLKTTSHSMCVYFYNAAFHYPFYAVEAPETCHAKAPATFPPGFRMGYLETRKHLVRGEVFCKTKAEAPWNV